MTPDVSADALGELDQLLESIGSLGTFGLFLVIFFNNAIKTLGVIILGVFFGVPPFFFVTLNGFVIGILISGLASDTGYGTIVAALAPHGVIEIPVLLLATSLGFAVGKESFRWLMGRRSGVRAELRHGLRLYFKWILVGILVAALIEVFVTPYIVRLSGG